MQTIANKNSQNEQNNIVIVGSGYAGMLAAAQLSQLKNNIYLIGLPPSTDLRTTTIMKPGIEMLKNIGVWQHISPFAAPLKALKMVDNTERLISSPTVNFSAYEIDISEFGYNFPNESLSHALQCEIEKKTNIKHIKTNVAYYSREGDFIAAHLEDGSTIKSRIIIGADGKKSKLREFCKINYQRISYQQNAIVLNFSHEISHRFCCREIHTKFGPFTQVPLVGNNSSLIWTVENEERAKSLIKDLNELEKKIAEKLNYSLGEIKITSPIAIWSLGTMIAATFAKDGVFLIGETSHSFPPIGAQGLNLTLRDIDDLYKIFNNSSINSNKLNKLPELEILYNKLRASDVKFRTNCVKNLNQSLISNSIAWQLTRLTAFSILKKSRFLRKVLMKEGMAPSKALNFISMILP